MARQHRKDRGFSAYTLADGAVRYAVRVYRNHHPHKWSGFTSKKEARDWYEDRRRDIREGRPFPSSAPVTETPLLSAIIDAYLTKSTHKKAYGIEKGYATFWKEQLGSIHIDQVTPTQIDAGRSALLDRGTGHATANRYTAWLHHVFKIEIDLGRLQKNPCHLFVRSSRKGGLKFPERPAPEQRWTDEELAILSERLGPNILVPMLALLTGLRQSEQFALRKDRMERDKGLGYLDDPKGGSPQVVHFNDDALKIIDYLWVQSGDSPWLFPSPRWPKTHHRNGKDWYARVFKTAAKEAGLTIGREHGKTWHTLRHTFADRLIDLKVHIKDVKDAGRWSSWQAMSRYLKRNRERVSSGVGLLKSPVPLDGFLTATKPPLLEDRDSTHIVNT